MLLSTTLASARLGGVAVAITYATFGIPIASLAGCAHGIELDLQPLPGEVGGSGSGPVTDVGVGSAGSTSNGGSAGQGGARGVGGMGPGSSTVSGGGAGGGGGSQGSGPGGSAGTGGLAGASGSTGVGGSAGAGGSMGGGGAAGGAGKDGGAGSGGTSGGAGQAGSAGRGGMGGMGDGGIVLRDAGPPVTVDDTVAGTGTNQFNYVGSWGHCDPCTTMSTPALFNTSNSWADGSDAGSTEFVTFLFVGQQITFYGVQDPRYGIGAASIDAGAESAVDFYATARGGNRPLWTSPIFARGAHSFKLRVTGTRNASSTGFTIAVDRVDVQ